MLAGKECGPEKQKAEALDALRPKQRVPKSAVRLQ